MPKNKKKEEQAEEPKPKTGEIEKPKAEETQDEADEMDFGGLPKDVLFDRNIGCGG
ncbi:hypothetical protein [Roseivirga pacifica]|uniref:hypothetical protein n=1 Tax=Roseivirga pacifica TaxID=1267423 RepID=UPI00227D4335|nr:hypothetical protein [Roseivirga pacifica]